MSSQSIDDPCLLWLRRCLDMCSTTTTSAMDTRDDMHSDLASTASSLITSAISFYERKLWHQLTQVLESLLNLESSTSSFSSSSSSMSSSFFLLSPELLRSMYHEFISCFRENMNPLKLAQIAVIVAKRGYYNEEPTLPNNENDKEDTSSNNGAMLPRRRPVSAESSEQFLQVVLYDLSEDLKLRPPNKSITQQASLYIHAHIAQCQLMRQQYASCQQTLDYCKKHIDSDNNSNILIGSGSDNNKGSSSDSNGDISKGDGGDGYGLSFGALGDVDASVRASVHYVQSQLAKSKQVRMTPKRITMTIIILVLSLLSKCYIVCLSLILLLITKDRNT